MEQENRGPPIPPVWTYGYEILPTLAPSRMQGIEAFLDLERSNARRAARTWEGRFVVEEQVTHILVVSDSPDQQLEANRRLEAELTRLKMAFSVTSPLEVTDRAQIALVEELPGEP
jgi:hypothetical protein